MDDIENYYNKIDKPIINNCINNLNLKNLLALSTITDLYVFTKKKKKNEWILKDKRELLKECEHTRKKTIKEASSSINILSKNKSSNIINEIKLTNNKLLNKIENIDSLIETIEKIYPTNSEDFIEVYSN
jgi:hypothetical protein